MRETPWKSLCRPAALRAQVTLQTRVKTSNGAGGYTEAWNTVAVVRAAVWLPDGSQAKLGAAVDSVKEGVIVVRSRPSFPAPLRVVWGARTFDAAVVVMPEGENRAGNYAGLRVIERVT